jgi:hypothetical protein
MSIEITSTTDSAEAVLTATGSVKETNSEPVKETDETAEESEPSETEETEETKANDEDSTDEDEQSEDEETEETEEKPKEEKKKKSGFKKRIERFERRLSEKEREIEHWKNEAMKKSEPKQSQETAKPNEDGKPKASQFETHEEFTEALTDWKLEQRDLKRKLEEQKKQAQSAQEKALTDFRSKAQEFAKSHDDFEDVLESVDDIPLSIGLHESILSSDLGPQVMYELSKNRKELERINKLTPLAAAREIGKIEALISKPEPKTKNTTKAPSPVKPVGGKADKATRKSIYDPNLSQAEYEKLREEQLSRK